MLPLNFCITNNLCLLALRYVDLQRNKYEKFRIKNCVYISFEPQQTFWTSAILLCSFAFIHSLPTLHLLLKQFSCLTVLSKSCSFWNPSKSSWSPGSPLQQITLILLLLSSTVALAFHDYIANSVTGNAKTFLDPIQHLATYQCVRLP